jgi:hypothetical protein
MNILTGWNLPLLTEGAVAVLGATAGRFGFCAVVGPSGPHLQLSITTAVTVMLCLGYNLLRQVPSSSPTPCACLLDDKA